MENQFEKIANLQLKLSENYSELDKEIIEKYWKIDNGEFVNSPRLIKKKYNISQSELTQIIKSYSRLSFYIYCSNCNSYELNEATSQSNFKDTISTFKSRYNKNSKCGECIYLEKKEQEAERTRRNKELLNKLNNAIDSRNWKNLSNFEKGVLRNGLEMGFYDLKKHYGGKLGQNNFVRFIRALESIESQNLFVLSRESWNNYITNHQYIERLLEYKKEIVVEKPQEPKQNTTTQHPKTNELKFKLTIDNERRHPDSPLYSGVVTFKEEIVLKPGVEYAFGQWERANNNLYLTMIPTSELEKSPKQQPLSRVPISLQEGIRNYFNRLGRNLDF